MDLLTLLASQLDKRSVGTFTINKHKNFREVFFEENSAYLVGESYSGKIAIDDLLAMGIVGQRLPLAKLEATIFSANLKKQPLPDILHGQGLLESGELEVLARAQVLEEMVDLFFRNSASFHFLEGRVPERLLGNESPVARTSLPLKVVLDELRRRNEAMAVYDLLVPSVDEVFVITETGMAYKQERRADFVLQRVFDLIDGFRDLRSIIQDSFFFEFRITCLIGESLEKGHIKKTVHPELRGISTNSLTPAEAERSLPFFKNAVKYGVDELAARERLAIIYEKLGNIDDAVIQYNFIGDALYRMRKAPKAIRAYQRALILKPGEALITDKISKIYLNGAEEELAKGEAQVAIQLLQGALKVRPDDGAIFKQLGDLLVRQKKLKEVADLCDAAVAQAVKTRSADLAVTVCEHIASLLPHSPAFRKKLINLHLDFGSLEKAAAEMLALAHVYSEQGQPARAQELIEKAQRLGTDNLEPFVIHQPLAVEAAIRAPAKRRVRLRVRRSHAMLLFLSFLLLFSIYQGWSLVVWNDLDSKSKLALALSHQNGEETHLAPDPEELRFVDLMRRCDQFLSLFPASLFRSQTEKLRLLVGARAADLTARRDLRKREILEEASRLFKTEGKHKEAQALLDQLLNLDAADGSRREAEALLEAMSEPSVPGADALLAEARQHEEMEEWETAYKKLRQLLNAYPDSELSRKLELPFQIDSFPTGADVFEVGNESSKTYLGKTRLVLQMEPGTTRTVKLELPGHVTLKGEVHEPQKGASSLGQHLFLLLRQPLWETKLEAPLATAPILEEGLFFGGTRKGSIVCIDLTTKQTSTWMPLAGTAENIVVPPVMTEEGLYTIWNDKLVVRFKVRAEKPGAQRVLVKDAESYLDNLASPPLLALQKSRRLVMGTSKKQIQSFARPSVPGTEQLPGWVLDLGDTATVIAMLPAPTGGEAASLEDLLLGTESGHILRLSGSPPNIAWNRKLGSAAITGAMVVGERVLATTASMEVYLLSTVDGASLGGLPVDGNPCLCLCPYLSKVLAVRKDGTITEISPQTGAITAIPNPVRDRFIRPPSSGLVALGDAIAVIHDGGRGLLILDSSTSDALDLLWATRMDEPITSVVQGSDRIAVATEAGRVAVFAKR